MKLRELDQIIPPPATEVEVLRCAMNEIANMAPGLHGDPDNHCYGEIRSIKAYVQRALQAATAP